jgi:hypothetical protein
MGSILKNVADYNAVRYSQGVDRVTFPDDAITSLAYLEIAEMVITKAVRKMNQATKGLCPTVTQIMNEDPPGTPAPLAPAELEDRTSLRAAVLFYIGWLFAPAQPNAVNVAVEQGDIALDLGGLGSQWVTSGEYAAGRVQYMLSLITGWVEAEPTPFLLNGKSRAGYDAGTISGMWASVFDVSYKVGLPGYRG